MKNTLEYNISSISKGQYSVEMNLASCMNHDQIRNFTNKLLDICSHDQYFQNIYSLNRNILRYKSETILPENIDKNKRKILLIFGNPATHSIEHGMFFFSNSRLSRHSMWKKLHDAGLVGQVNYSHLKEKSLFKKRELEAQTRKESILNGNSSEAYSIGLTTFYSLPTPVTDKYIYSNVAGVLRIFKEILNHMHEMEIERILNYKFTRNAILVFIQQDSYNTFTSNKKSKIKNIYSKYICWPAVSRKQGALNKGTDLIKMLQ